MTEVRKLSAQARQQVELLNSLIDEIKKVIVGQEKLISRLVISLITRNHVLLEGVPGLAKTLSVKTLCQGIQAKFQRIQFTPDLLPADLIGTRIYNQKTGEFYTKKGPIFANLVLADEINRSPAKVQSALLEAMQEKQVTIGNDTFELEPPFMVLATQNPIETEGTYALPEAQIDRFMLKVKVGYPNKEEELEIIERMTTGHEIKVESVLKPKDIFNISESVAEIYVDEKIKKYIVDIVFATRFPQECGLPGLKSLIEYGASPRASLFLTEASKGLALLNGRGYVTPDDIKEMAYDVINHRIILSYEAEAEERTSEDIIAEILKKIKVP